MRQLLQEKDPNKKEWRAGEMVEVRKLVRGVLEGSKSPPLFL